MEFYFVGRLSWIVSHPRPAVSFKTFETYRKISEYPVYFFHHPAGMGTLPLRKPRTNKKFFHQVVRFQFQTYRPVFRQPVCGNTFRRNFLFIFWCLWRCGKVAGACVCLRAKKPQRDIFKSFQHLFVCNLFFGCNLFGFQSFYLFQILIC